MITKSNRLNSILLTFLVAALSLHAAPLQPITATGWNHDIVYGGGESGQGISGSMDNGPGFFGANWYGVGRNTAPGAESTGLPFLPTESISTPTDLIFQLQPFAGGANAVLLNNGQGGLLTLTTPTPYLRLALIGSTGNGTANDLITISFADGSTETFGGGAINQDWFFNTAGVAYTANGRTSNNEGTAFDNVNNGQPRVYQEIFTLANRSSEVISVGITNNGGGHSAIMAISGEAIPEPSALMLIGAGVGWFASRRKRYHWSA
jgi:hypothetical protein